MTEQDFKVGVFFPGTLHELAAVLDCRYQMRWIGTYYNQQKWRKKITGARKIGGAAIYMVMSDHIADKARSFIETQQLVQRTMAVPICTTLQYLPAGRACITHCICRSAHMAPSS